MKKTVYICDYCGQEKNEILVADLKVVKSVLSGDTFTQNGFMPETVTIEACSKECLGEAVVNWLKPKTRAIVQG